MGSTGLSFDIKRVGDGDLVELFYEVKELLVERIWNVTSSLTGFRDYLGSEDFASWMSDRYQPTETSLYYAFWEQVEAPICGYAIHVAAICAALGKDELEARCARRGFSIDLSGYALEDQQFGYYAMHGSTRVCRVLPWRRGEPITAEPRFACAERTPHRGKAPTGSQLRRLRNCAMTGLCACTQCCVHRAKPGLDTDAIALAWQFLDADRAGAELAVAAETDAAARTVLGDWLEQRGAKLVAPTLAALARSYARAEA